MKKSILSLQYWNFDYNVYKLFGIAVENCRKLIVTEYQCFFFLTKRIIQ